MQRRLPKPICWGTLRGRDRRGRARTEWKAPEQTKRMWLVSTFPCLSEKGVSLAQNMQVVPCTPVRIQLQKGCIGPTSGQTWRLSHFGRDGAALDDGQHVALHALARRIRAAPVARPAPSPLSPCTPDLRGKPTGKPRGASDARASREGGESPFRPGTLSSPPCKTQRAVWDATASARGPGRADLVDRPGTLSPPS